MSKEELQKLSSILERNTEAVTKNTIQNEVLKVEVGHLRSDMDNLVQTKDLTGAITHEVGKAITAQAALCAASRRPVNWTGFGKIILALLALGTAAGSAFAAAI